MVTSTHEHKSAQQLRSPVWQAQRSLHLLFVVDCSGRITGSLAAHPGVPGQLFYIVGSSVVAMFDLNPLKQLQLRGHDDAVTAFCMSPDGALLATGQRGQNSDVIIWNTQTLTQQFRFQVRMASCLVQVASGLHPVMLAAYAACHC